MVATVREACEGSMEGVGSVEQVEGGGCRGGRRVEGGAWRVEGGDTQHGVSGSVEHVCRE